MLGKLLKYEFKATSRYFMFLYSAVLGLAIINKIFWLIPTDNVVMNVVRGFIMAAFVIATVATLIFSFVIIIYRFYKNLLSDEGYLSFTLPVTSTKHIISKMLISVLWIIVTGIVVMISLLIMAIDTGFYGALPEVFHFMGEFFKANPEMIKFVIEMILIMMVAMFSGTLMLYTSMSIGHLFSKHRVIASIVSFFGIYFVVQALNSIILGITMAIGFGSDAFTAMGSETDVSVNMNSMDLSSVFTGPAGLTYNTFLDIISSIFIVTVIMQIVLGTVYFLVTRYILKKKLNLE